MAILSIVQLGDPVLRRPVRVAGRGLLARVLQHELDHLDGHLYLDRLDSLDDLRRVEADGALVET